MTKRVESRGLRGLRIGCVKYLNARPLIHGWPGEVEFDHPSALCARLAAGTLDVALVSSFEFLRNPIYRIVDDVSISSAGPVYSVFVAHRDALDKIDNIQIDPASATSVNLLRCLLAERKLRTQLVEQPAAAHLLIGDQAIEFRQKNEKEFSFWDLGEAWSKLVDLPFVYALWLIRPEVVDPKSIADQLRALRDENSVNIDKLLAEEKERDHVFCARYYREHLRFSLGEKEKEGLREFQRRCQEHGLLPKLEIEFSFV